MTQSALSRGRLDIAVLWPWTVLAAFGVLVSLIPTPPNDLWWHLKIGELIFEASSIPTTSIFAWTLPATTPFVYAAWLGELLLFLLHRWGGLELLICARTLTVLVAFWLTGREARRRSGSWRVAALVLLPACAMSLNNLIVRPQMWSFVPFVVIMILLRCYADGVLRGWWLLACPPLMAFWVNVHGAFVLGLVLGGAWTAGELISGLGRRHQRGWWRQSAWLGAVTAMMGLATLANPRGLGIVSYVTKLMTDPPSQGLIVEWQSPTPHGISNVAFYLSILLTILVFLYARRAPRPADILLLFGFLWLAWTGQRYVIWYALVAAPILAEAIGNLGLRLLSSPSLHSGLNTALACLLFVPVAAVQPWWVERLSLTETYWAQVHRNAEVGPLLETSTPLGAVEYLRMHPGGKLFNEMGYGSYLIWALPEQQVFIDPRVELYPYEQWLDYIRISDGIRYDELLKAYGADRLLLDLENQKELANLLRGDPQWRLEYEDARSQIWTRVSD